VRVNARPEIDLGVPGAASEIEAVQIDQRSATIRFVAPGEDGEVGLASGYEIRYRAGTPITEENFADAEPLATSLTPDEPGQVQLFEMSGLLPETTYYIGIRAFDDCRNNGPVAVAHFDTPDRTSGEVDACFVATAAYGSPLASEVTSLRAFRDRVLRQSVLGELFVETYYTVGPAFSTNIAHSDVLRQAARTELEPLVELVRRR
jgi:hypothetical protein